MHAVAEAGEDLHGGIQGRTIGEIGEASQEQRDCAALGSRRRVIVLPGRERRQARQQGVEPGEAQGAGKTETAGQTLQAAALHKAQDAAEQAQASGARDQRK